MKSAVHVVVDIRHHFGLLFFIARLIALGPHRKYQLAYRRASTVSMGVSLKISWYSVAHCIAIFSQLSLSANRSVYCGCSFRARWDVG
jgi:hypothetical protein